MPENKTVWGPPQPYRVIIEWDEFHNLFADLLFENNKELVRRYDLEGDNDIATFSIADYKD